MSGLHSIVREALSEPQSASTDTAPLTAHDRCDVGDCGAAARVRALFATGPLLFCGHHYDALAASGKFRNAVTAIHSEGEVAK